MSGTASNPKLFIVPDQRGLERTIAGVQQIQNSEQFGSVEERTNAVNRALKGEWVNELTLMTPAEHAQDIMYEAFEASGRRRVTLAKQALKVFADCADAYVLLAEEDAKEIDAARLLFLKGVEAAKRTLPKEYFASPKFFGQFWKMIDTRPYMRARSGLASVLWAIGDRDAAIGHLQDMLRLNPTDNQGVRDPLLAWFLVVGRDKEAAALLQKYDGERSAVHMYGLAYLAFKQFGPSRRASNFLRAAFRANPFVPLVFIEEEAPVEPMGYCYGDRDEADFAVVTLIEAFAALPEFLKWVFGLIEKTMEMGEPEMGRFLAIEA